MVSYMILRAVSTRALASTAPSWRAALSSWTPGAALGMLQAIALWGVLHLLLGLRAEHTLAAVGFAALVAVVFASIHQAFVAWFGGVGRFF